MAGPIEEISVSKGDVGGSQLDLLLYVVQDHVFGCDEKPSFVNGDNRAVKTGVETSSTGLDISHHVLRFLIDEFGISV